MAKPEKSGTRQFLDSMQKNQSRESSGARRNSIIANINRARTLKQLKQAIIGMFN